MSFTKVKRAVRSLIIALFLLCSGLIYLFLCGFRWSDWIYFNEIGDGTMLGIIWITSFISSLLDLMFEWKSGKTILRIWALSWSISIVVFFLLLIYESCRYQ
ncbi:MAG: hypothetical protein HQ519_13965 [Planctomycetes bacterium]|nr:hypothetical protein [Planctomycetota bacterium]